MSATSTRTYPCARCGKHARPEAMIFSRFTGNRYCVDDKACDRRRKRKAKR